jgi:hypothetical protein
MPNPEAENLAQEMMHDGGVPPTFGERIAFCRGFEEGRKSALEEAAKVCDHWYLQLGEGRMGALYSGRDIRALKELK